MRLTTLIFIFTLVAFSLSGCSKIYSIIPIPQTIKEYYPNGNLKEEGTLIKGVAEGKYKTYYEDGSLRSTGSIVHGLYNGEQRSYYKNGVLEQITLFKDHVILALTHFDEQGDKDKDLVFENGQLVKGIYYQKNSKEKVETIYDLSSGTALYKYYGKEGNLLAEYHSNNKEEGLDGTLTSKIYYENGNLRAKGTLYNGKPVGRIISYKEDGSIASETDINSDNKENRKKPWNYPWNNSKGIIVNLYPAITIIQGS